MIRTVPEPLDVSRRVDDAASPIPLPRTRAIVASAWIALVLIGFLRGIAGRLVWHLFS